MDDIAMGALLMAFPAPTAGQRLALWCRRLVGAQSVLNVCWRRVGGLFFIKVGRLTVSFSVSREYRPL